MICVLTGGTGGAKFVDGLRQAMPAEDITRLRSIRHFDGLPLDARTVTDKLVLQEGI